MSSDFVYNSQYNRVMSGGYMIGSGIFKENIETEHILRHNKNLAVPIGLMNFNGGGGNGSDNNKMMRFEDSVKETDDSGINAMMSGGSAFDSMLNQMNPTYEPAHKKNGGERSRKGTKTHKKQNSSGKTTRSRNVKRAQ